MKLSNSEYVTNQFNKKKVKIKGSVKRDMIDLDIDKQTREAIELEEDKIKTIQLMENIVEVKPVKIKSPKIKLEPDNTVKVSKVNLEAQEIKNIDEDEVEKKHANNTFEDADMRFPPPVESLQIKHLQNKLNESKDTESDMQGTKLFLRNSPETNIGNLLENLPNVNKFTIHVTKIQKYLRPNVEEDKSVRDSIKEKPIVPKLVEIQSFVSPNSKEMLTSTLILKESPKAAELTEESRIDNNEQIGIKLGTESCEKQKVKNKFTSYQMKLADKAKAAQPPKDDVRHKESESQKPKMKQAEKKKVITKTAMKETVETKSPTTQKINDIKPKEKPLLKCMQSEKSLAETKTSEKKIANINQMKPKKVKSKQLEKQVPVSKQLENLAKTTIHSDENLGNTKQQIKVTKIQTYLRPKPDDGTLNKAEEKKIFENLTTIEKGEVSGQNKSNGEIKYIKPSVEREAVEISILESLESRRLKEEHLPVGLGVAARNAAEMAMQGTDKQLVNNKPKVADEIIKAAIQEQQGDNVEENISKSSKKETIVIPPTNKVDAAIQALKQKYKGTKEGKEADKERIGTKLSDHMFEKTQQVLKENWQKVKKQKTVIEEGKQTLTKRLDDKLGLKGKWNKVTKQKSTKSSLKEKDQEIAETKPLVDTSGEIEQHTEDHIKEQQEIIRKILEECVMLDQKNPQKHTGEKSEDLITEAKQPETSFIEKEETEETENDSMFSDKKLTVTEKLDKHLGLKQKWQNVCKLKDDIKEKNSKKIKEESKVLEGFHVKAQNVIKEKLQKYRKPKVTVELTKEMEEPVVGDEAMVGWFNKEDVPEEKESIEDKTELEIKQPQHGWFDKFGSFTTESSLSMVGSPNLKLFREVDVEQKEAPVEETGEADPDSQQFGWFNGGMDVEPVDKEQERPKETQKGLKQKWGKCRSVVNTVMRPMK